jgi:hypothetical protein
MGGLDVFAAIASIAVVFGTPIVVLIGPGTAGDILD